MRRWSLLLLLTALTGCEHGDYAAEDAPFQLGRDFRADHFLQFFSKQPTLAAGDYALVVVPAAGGTGSYTLTATGDDGNPQLFTGAWTALASSDPADADNPSHTISLLLPGGLDATLTAAPAACVYLLDRAGNILFRDGDAVPATDACDVGGTEAALDLPASHTDALAYAEAFYATVDCDGERETLEEFQAVNNLEPGNEDVHVIFRDTKDLGYGRNMYFRTNTVNLPGPSTEDVYAFYVRNFQVKAIPGQNYGPLNLNAAIAEQLQYHIGTNAIEWGPVDADCDGDYEDVNGDGTVDTADFFTRHYTFDPAPVQTRRLVVDLDGKGAKAMPVPCILCHGGRADPLLPDGSFPRFGDTKAKLQALDVGSFEYSDESGWTRAELEPGLLAINRAVYKSYAPLEDPPPGEWDSSMAREMMESWYGGATAGELDDNPFDGDYVPDGWQPDVDDGFPPAGADVLYRDLVSQDCRTCHLLRGVVHQSDIDFTSYAKFIDHADQIEPFVFDKGIMPLAFLTFDNFWDTSGLPELLASHLPGFSRYDGDGAVLRPGRPIANAGPDRTAPAPVTISGSASLFAQGYAWTIASGPGGGAIADPAAVRTSLSGPDGTYVLELVVTKDGEASVADSATITIDSGAADPKDLTFDDIRAVLQDTPGECVGCHFPPQLALCTLPNPLPPVFWTDPEPLTDCAATLNRDLYTDFRARVDFVDPVNSRVLRKPSGKHHAGGELTGFDHDCDGSCDRSNYDLFLDWIIEGGRRE